MQVLTYEVLNPFYIFQVFSVILWTWTHYYTYAACILLISTGSVVFSLIETIKNHENIRAMARYECKVNRMEVEFKETDSSELVPGDIIEIEP